MVQSIEGRGKKEEFPSNCQVSISIWRKLIRSCNSDGVAHNHSSHNSLISNFLLSGAERSKDNFISYFLWRRERSKKTYLFSYFLAQKEAKTSTYPKSFPIWKNLTEEWQKPLILRPFWYRGTRDEISLSAGA